MTWTATTTSIVVLDAFRDRFDLALLAVSSTELETAHLERAQTVTEFDDVDQAVQVVGRENWKKKSC